MNVLTAGSVWHLLDPMANSWENPCAPTQPTPPELLLQLKDVVILSTMELNCCLVEGFIASLTVAVLP